jgi:hypothetical protein
VQLRGLAQQLLGTAEADFLCSGIVAAEAWAKASTASSREWSSTCMAAFLYFELACDRG